VTVPPGRRIDAEVPGRRGARVVALDDRAATLVRRLAREPWHGAHFATLPADRPVGDDLWLHTCDGRRCRLDDELADADVVVMVSTAAGVDRAAAGLIGEACRRRGITTAAVVVGDQDRTIGTVHALRPHARVLLTGPDPGDVGELLTALRA
jgi:hypothetical protein